MNIDEQIEQQEERVFQRFEKDFNSYFLKIQRQSKHSNCDLRATGNTGQLYYIELKERLKYNCSQMSGGTFLEVTKLDYFQAVHNCFPDAEILYFIYYNDGYICYHITPRIKAKTSQILHQFEVSLPNTTYNKTYIKNKMVCSLGVLQDYDDKIVLYTV